MKESADIVIVGAGVIVLSTALQLRRRSNARIVVLERANGVGAGSSGASSAICRHLYTHPQMITLARDGINVYKQWMDFVQLSQPRAQFQQHGVLWFGHADSAHKGQLASLGIAAEMLSDAELVERFPAINPCTLTPDFIDGTEHDCTGGGTHLFEPEAGYMDPQYVLEDLLDTLRAEEVEVRFSAQVTRLCVESGSVTGVECADAKLSAPVVVNASGPWCNALLSDIDAIPQWPLVPTRIQVLYLDRPVELEGHIPVCADAASGIYFRTQNQGQQLIVGSTRPEDDQEAVADPDHFDKLTDDSFATRSLHALHHRLPQLPYRGKVGGYAGLYTVNQTDMHPLVGDTPITGLFIANGFSGHGFKLAPAIGSLLAQQITGQVRSGDTAVPASFLNCQRQPIDLTQKSVLA